ncbi:ATP-grasp domain-containing protein [Heyndrickxia coagulans]|uniref:ATP-grasp domain-containing protein n=1 Tax=Heyndrickxia coagulans TaxID=1398 RepID=UPI001F41E356|nr:ATP-grasp domain-containing protein [Heyndrickxia coagulans]
MKNNRVLILGVASVQMEAILELKKMGFETYACAMAKDGPGADAADHFAKINILDIDKIITFIKDNEISLVYSVGSDIAMPIVSLISERLHLPHFVTNDTARVCNNKDLMRKILGNDFRGNVKFQVVKSRKDKLELDFPFILKPTDSQGQRGVKLVNNYEEYLEGYEVAKSYSRSGLVILEQYISGPEISVNGYLVNGEIQFLVASDRDTWPQFTGLIHKHIVPSKNLNSSQEQDLKTMLELACKKLKINNGPVYAQIKLEKGAPYIIEITPRLDGCHMWNILKLYTGVNLIKLTFQHLINNNISELNNGIEKFKDNYVLEFICQEPNSQANYSKYDGEMLNCLYSFKYYNQDDLIRPVNGKYEKIGYFIKKI